MLYEEYEKKIQRRARIRKKIRRFRFLILGGVAVTIGTAFGLSYFRGTIQSQNNKQNTYVYGETISLSAKAFLNYKVHWEYKNINSEEWNNITPIHVGKYIARPYSYNNFSKKIYGKEESFEIIKRDSEISFESDEITYGDTPTVKLSNPATGDVIKECDVTFDSYVTFTPTCSVNMDTLVIENKDGTRVNSDYNLTFKDKTLTIKQRNITFKFNKQTKEYDGKELIANDYVLSGSLAGSDYVSIHNESRLLEVGNVDATALFDIYNEHDVNVTMFYNINVIPSYLEITPRKITFTSKSASKEYDGYPFDASTFECPEITKGSLLEGDTIEYTYFQSDDYKAGKFSNYYTITILDKDGNDVTYTHYDPTFFNGELEITKRNIS